MKQRRLNQQVSGAATVVAVLAGLVWLLTGIHGALLRAVTASTAAEQTLSLLGVVLGLVALVPFLAVLGGLAVLVAGSAVKCLLRHRRHSARKVIPMRDRGALDQARSRAA